MTYEMEMMRKYPYALVSWNIIREDIDMENPTDLDKILLLSHEFAKYNINDFQYSGSEIAPSVYLNKVFGLKGTKGDFYYGVNSVSIMGYSYGHSARIPRVEIEYKTGDWRTEYHVIIGSNTLPKNTEGRKYRFATDAEIKEVIEYMETLVEERKKVIAAQKENPSFDEFSKMCLAKVDTYLKNSVKNVSAELSVGKRTKDTSDYTAIVVERNTRDSERSIFDQLGHIGILQNEFGEFTLSCNVPLGGEWDSTLVDWKNYDEVLDKMCNYIVG